MAYNNNFPVGYQPAQIYYPQQQQPYQPMMQQQVPQQQPQPQTNNSIIWVQGEAGAKSYLVAPNTTVQLWDSENQVIYLKSADASGMPSMKVLDYTIRPDASSVPSAAFQHSNSIEVSRTDLDALQRQIDDLREQLKTYQSQPQINHMKEGDKDGKPAV